MSRPHKHLHPLPDLDPFTPDDGYSPDELMTPACDEKGHTAQKRIAFKPDVFPVLNQIVASGQFEYRCPEDIVRDAVYHRIHYLADRLGVTYTKKGQLQGQIAHVVNGAAAIAELERFARQREERQKYVETLRDELAESRRAMDKGGFDSALMHAQLRLEGDWLCEPYRSEVQAIVDRAGREGW